MSPQERAKAPVSPRERAEPSVSAWSLLEPRAGLGSPVCGRWGHEGWGTGSHRACRVGNRPGNANPQQETPWLVQPGHGPQATMWVPTATGRRRCPRAEGKQSPWSLGRASGVMAQLWNIPGSEEGNQRPQILSVSWRAQEEPAVTEATPAWGLGLSPPQGGGSGHQGGWQRLCEGRGGRHVPDGHSPFLLPHSWPPALHHVCSPTRGRRAGAFLAAASLSSGHSPCGTVDARPDQCPSSSPSSVDTSGTVRGARGKEDCSPEEARQRVRDGEDTHSRTSSAGTYVILTVIGAAKEKYTVRSRNGGVSSGLRNEGRLP